MVRVIFHPLDIKQVAMVLDGTPPTGPHWQGSLGDYPGQYQQELPKKKMMAS